MTATNEQKPRPNPYQPALDRAQADLSRLDPYEVAALSGAHLVEGPALMLSFWGQALELAWPTGEVRASARSLHTAWHLVILHYLVTADGTPQADRWLSFRELPDGRVYDAAFRRRACLPLARGFGERPEAFVAAATRLAGLRLEFGDASFMFQVLPRVRVAVVLHVGDEEFPPNANVLFDASLRHYLPIEDVAVLGGLVAAELLRAKSG